MYGRIQGLAPVSERPVHQHLAIEVQAVKGVQAHLHLDVCNLHILARPRAQHLQHIPNLGSETLHLNIWPVKHSSARGYSAHRSGVHADSIAEPESSLGASGCGALMDAGAHGSAPRLSTQEALGDLAVLWHPILQRKHYSNASMKLQAAVLLRRAAGHAVVPTQYERAKQHKLYSSAFR